MDNVLVNLSNSSTSEQNNRGVHKQPIQGLQGGLKVVNYGYDSTNKNIVPLAVDNNGHLDIDVQVADLVMRANDGNDGSGTDRTVKCDANGELQVAVSSTALPTGASTLAEQQTQTTKLTSIDGKITACNTGAVVVSSSALPTGASTEATLSALEAHATDGTQVAQIKANTAKDGTGNSYSPLVDADGHLQVDVLSGGGGGTQFAVGSALGATPTGTLLVGRDGSGNADDVLITNANELRVADTTSQSSLATIAGDTTSIDGKITACNTGAVVVSSSALPSGGSTLAEQQSQTALLTTMDADTSALAGCVGGTELQVDIVSSALPSGAATEATLATIDADTSALAGCVSGTELQVDIVSSALPSGGSTLAEQQTQTTKLTSIDGKITACNTGAVVVSSSALPSGASTLAEQQSQTALLTTIDADTSALAGCVGGGELQVDIVSSALPSGAATEATLATIDADTSALAGCVNGGELQVDVISSALPSGASTSALQTTGNSSLADIDTATTSIDTKTRDKSNSVSNQTSIAVSSNGKAVSTSIDTADFNKFSVVCKDNSNGNLRFILQQSWDNSTFFGSPDTNAASNSQETFEADGTTSTGYFWATNELGTPFFNSGGGGGGGGSGQVHYARYLRVQAFDTAGSATTFDVHWYRIN